MSEPVTSLVISKWVIFSAWSVFGGITHALVEHRAGHVKSFVDGVILSFISGFCGMMWTLIAVRSYPNDWTIIGFAGGLGGYLSLQGLAMMANFLKNKILK